MPLDPSIPLSVKPVNIDPIGATERAYALRDLMARQQQHDVQMQEYQRTARERATLADLYRRNAAPGGTVNRAGLLSDLAASGLGHQLPGIAKQFSEQDKAAADLEHVKAQTGKTTADTAAAKQKTWESMHDRHLQALGGVDSPEAMAAWLVQGGQSGALDGQRAAAAYSTIQRDPSQWQAIKVNLTRAALSVKDQLPKAERIDNGGSVVMGTVDPVTGQWSQTGAVRKVASPDAVLSASTTRRGQDMADRRERERAAQTDAQSQFIPVDGVGLYVGNKRTGEARPVMDTSTGKPVVPNKSLTEGQARANLFGTRMQEADRIINELAAKGVVAPSFAQQVTGGEGITGRLATAAASPAQQQVDQAQRDFLNAVLRRESGAVITQPEFENARKQYFVQPGDSPQVVAQKARNRTTAIRALLDEVPENRRTVVAPPAGAAPAAKNGGGGLDWNTLGAKPGAVDVGSLPR